MSRIFSGICVVAWFINIGLYIFASSIDLFDLQILALVNMLLLSFVLLREPNPK
tara:strand:- start:235 stop:396 length:162 start_codon:yes stop_codon:yes gene_type:complete